MATLGIAAIDVHAHLGPYDGDGVGQLQRQWMGGDAATVVARASAANTAHTVVSPFPALMPRGRADAVAANDEAAAIVDATDGLWQWVVVNPLQPATFAQAREMLRRPKCVGIKIHPDQHVYPIAQHGRAIFEFAAELGAVVQTHSGDANSPPDDFVPFANDFPEVTLILSHLGCDGLTGPAFDLQVRAIQAAKHGNVYTDTSSMRSLVAGLIEWAVGEVGADRILYGTDSPAYFAPAQRARIDHAELGDDDKRRILHDNAQRLLGID